MKVREVVTNVPCDGATTLAVIGALGDAGILDAEVIGLPCKTCGGERFIDGESGLPWSKALAKCAEDGGECIRGDCPDCPPVWVIAPEAWEAFRIAVGDFEESGGVWSEADEDVAMVKLLQALLPGARVAKFVGEIYQGNPDNGNPMWVDTPLPFEHPAWPEVTLTDGDTIAILARQEEVEE